MTENSTYKKEIGNSFIVGTVTLVLMVVCFCSQMYSLAIAMIFFETAVIVNALRYRRKFKEFCKFEASFEGKSLRQKITAITADDKIFNLYLHYGTREDFECFECFFDSLVQSDPLYAPLYHLLEMADNYGSYNLN